MLRPIYNKKRPDPRKVVEKVDKTLRNFAAEFARQASTYPPDQPPARYYRRTGDLGRFWVVAAAQSFPKQEGGSRTITIINRVTERRARRGKYARFVQGGPNQQAALMAARNWEQAIVIGRRVWDKYKLYLQTDIQQV